MTKPFRPFFFIIIIKNELSIAIRNEWQKQKKLPNKGSNFGKRKRKNNCNVVCSLITKSCYGFQFVIAEFEDLCFFLASFTFCLCIASLLDCWLEIQKKIWNLGGWMKRNAYNQWPPHIFSYNMSESDSFFLFWSHSPDVMDLVYCLQLFHGYISSFSHSMLVHHLFICETVEIMKNYFSTTNKQWK